MKYEKPFDALPIKIRLPNEFEKEVVQQEFLVDKRRRKIWAIELDLLTEFDRVCKKYNIKYFVAFGTLLGTIRHKGFIPWDDDVDLCLERKDFNKLCKVAFEFTHPYFFQTAYTDQQFFCPYARLRNSDTTGVVAWEASSDYNNGIYLDVFVLDGYAFGLKHKIQRVLLHILTKILSEYHGLRIKYLTFSSMLLWMLRPFAHLVGYTRLVKVYDWIIQWYTERNNRLSLLTHKDDELEENTFYKHEIEKIRYRPFEFLNVPVPEGWESILKREFGDYMVLPPKEKRGMWHENMIIFDPDISYKEYFRVQQRKMQQNPATILTVITAVKDVEIAGHAFDLKRCLKSVSSIAIPHEHLIIDGLSRDNTCAIIRRCASSDDCIKLYSERDSGIFDAYNKGLQKAQGQWVYYLGADDYISNPDYIVSAVEYAERKHADFVLSPVQEGERVAQVKLSAKLQFMGYSHQGVIMRKCVMMSLGGFDLRYQISADADLMLRAHFNCHGFAIYNHVYANFGTNGISSANYDLTRRETTASIAALLHLTERERCALHNKRILPINKVYRFVFHRDRALRKAAFCMITRRLFDWVGLIKEDGSVGIAFLLGS